MSTIDYKNIDEWLFNYFEGNLSAPETDLLTAFLNKNPALKADYDAWKKSYVHEPVMEYPNINSLLKPQVAPGTNRIKWSMVLLMLAGLLVFYKTVSDPDLKLPAELLTERSFGPDAGRQQTELLPFMETEKAGKTVQLMIAPLILTGTNSGKEAIRQAGQLYLVKSFVMESRVIPADLSYSTFSPDSLEIIIKPQPAAPKTKGSGKQKKHLKGMNVIRIQNSGF
jgi:hypothetical protein